MADLRNFTYDNMVELIRQIRHGVDENLTEIDEKIDKNAEDISDINDTVEGLVSQNINPNIFRGTNVYAELQPVNSSNTWSTGEWCLYSNSSGTNSVQPIELTDSPIDDVEVGWEIDNSEGILQSNIPLAVGTYTISAYIRGDGNAYLVYLNNNGTSTTQSLGSSFSDWTYIAVTLNNTLDSQTLGFSHSSTSSSGPGGSGGGPGGGTTNQSIEICGMKLEASDSETAWCPAYYDMENKYLQEDLDAISTDVTEVQNQVTEVSTTITSIQTQVTENTTNISTAQQQITEIIAEGGEPNVIEEVQVNGATLAIEDKTVNVPVPTKTSELENDSDFTTGSEVKSEIAAQIAEVVADAPEDLDTLKEIADWIENHAEDAAAMNSEIKANATDIADLASQADSTQSQVDNISSTVNSLQTQVNSIDELATANKTAIEDVQSQVEELQNQSSYVISYVKESKTLDISGG